MTSPDPGRIHIIIGPHQYAEDRWWAACTCGDEFFGLSDGAVRDHAEPHRRAQRNRLSNVEAGGAGVGE